MGYTKFALKYRPRKLEDLVGQDTVCRVLSGAIKNDKIPRTFLIHGPWGSGKTTTARLIASYLNCQNRSGLEPPCGQCPVCQSMEKNPPAHHDYIEVNAANSRGIDDIRSLVDQARFKPRSNYRIFVLDECHQLTQQAFQALLKPLEEPESRTIWILCTTDLPKIPKAIVSRCSKLAISKVAIEDTLELLKKVVDAEEIDLDENVIIRVAQATHGHPRDALTVLEAVASALDSGEELTEELFEETVRDVVQEPPENTAGAFLLGCYQGKYTAAISVLKRVSKYDSFALKVLEMHEHTIRYRASKSLQDQYFIDWYDSLRTYLEVDNKKLLTMDILSKQLEYFMVMADKIKSYSGVDAEHHVFYAAVKAVEVSFKAGIPEEIKAARAKAA